MEKQWLEKDACGIGAVVNMNGTREHKVVSDALSIVERLEHRAGKDATGTIGDGVGILTQISHEFFRKAGRAFGLEDKEQGDYGVGMFFFPKDEALVTLEKNIFEELAEKNGLRFLGWREVPVHRDILGEAARVTCPLILQCFIERPVVVKTGFEFDRLLYVLRREYEKSSKGTYVCSLSSRTIVYKGMLLVGQLRTFYDDLRDEDYLASVAIVHSRFSTNTKPSWKRAHPYRYICHNGEINTIHGNVDRMLAREETMVSDFAEKYKGQIFPVIEETGSDSACLDNTFEFLCMNGMDPALAMMLLIPEPWQGNPDMDSKKKDFYHYYATMMEPWDGPAAILFTDGEIFGATLDRNGLRPSRYYITYDNRLILASEVGVLDIPQNEIKVKSRLMPGRMLLCDMKSGRLITDEECKRHFAGRAPYGEWLAKNLLPLRSLSAETGKPEGGVLEETVRRRLCKVFGVTFEDIKNLMLPMAENAAEPTVSMGHDTPLAVLSKHHPLLFSYFKQLFAQVTNPPIDAIREKCVTDTTIYIGSDGNLLNEQEQNCRILEVEHPILTKSDMEKIAALDQPGFRARRISILFYKHTSLQLALDNLEREIDRAAEQGVNILILSDKGVDRTKVPIPSLLAVSAAEQYLVRTRKRTLISIIIETGEVRNVHQTATLLSFGARAVYPYLAHECIRFACQEGFLTKPVEESVDNFNKALLDGVLKVASKMGISTLQSYQSARIFEAVGINKETLEKYFGGIIGRIGGIGLKEIEQDVLSRHEQAYDPLEKDVDLRPDSIGFHRLRSGKGAEEHLFHPLTIVTLQKAVRNGDYTEFKKYTSMLEKETPHNIRSVMAFKKENRSVLLSEVQPAEEIVKRFQTGAMSFGSLSQEAHETLAIAMNRIGGKSNTGEGGEDPERYGTDRNSAVKQVASGRFGVTGAYLNSAQEIQIKIAQGAKPGEGGRLPGNKVYPKVAQIRCCKPGTTLISPPPHHDIYSIEDLAQLIYDLKNANRRARISVKLVSEEGVGTICCGVAKAGADVILISGYDGGTGAAPVSSVHGAGLPWELGLSEAHNALVESGLRDRVILETDGKLMSGRDVAIAALLGAEEFGFATAPLVSIGCIMMRVCSKDTCPAGIATQNEKLRKCFQGKPEHVINFMMFVAEELREIMAGLGFRTIDEMVGRSDLLETVRNAAIDTSCVLGGGNQNIHYDKHNAFDLHLENTLDETVLLPVLEQTDLTQRKAEVPVKVTCKCRTLGTILGSEITRRYRDELKEDAFVIRATGGAGQSLGAFMPKGETIILEGDGNDGVGKGLSGGKIVVVPPKECAYDSEENIIIGNVALYGATGGKLYARGIAGERFAVRNSGALAVCEGCGDHGFEYMTGGVGVILGETGRNIGAGMSGGKAYLYDPADTLESRLNPAARSFCRQMTEDDPEKEELRAILNEYERETGSKVAGQILRDYDLEVKSFKKLVPLEGGN